MKQLPKVIFIVGLCVTIVIFMVMMTLSIRRDERDRLDTPLNALAPTPTTPSDFELQKVAAGNTGVASYFTGPLCSDQRNIIVKANVPWGQSLDQSSGEMVTVQPGERVRFAMKASMNVGSVVMSATGGPPGGIDVDRHYCNPGGGGCGESNPTFNDRQKNASGDPSTTSPVEGSVEIVTGDAILIEAPTKIDHPGSYNLAMEYTVAGPCGVYEWGYANKCREVGVGHQDCTGPDACWSKTSFRVCAGTDPPPTSPPTKSPPIIWPPTSIPVQPTTPVVFPTPVVTIVGDGASGGYSLHLGISDNLVMTQNAWNTFAQCARGKQISLYFGDKQYLVSGADWGSRQFVLGDIPSASGSFRGMYVSDSCSYFIQ